MAILGEASLDEAGVLHGWCWSPDAPAERRAVEILIDEDVVATMIASRFREDLRGGAFGDGYHGFTLGLTKQIGEAAKGAMLRTRDLGSGICFWQTRLGAYEMPAAFGVREARVRDAIARGANAQVLAGGALRSAALASSLGALGAELSARGGVRQPSAPGFTLPAPTEPRLSVIMDAGADGAAALHALRLGAPAFAEAGAEVLLTDDGRDARTMALQREAKNLGYLYAGGQMPAARRNLAAAASRGGTLVFLQPAEPGPEASLAMLPAGVIVVAGRIADAARRVAPGMMLDAAELQVPPWPGFLLAMPRAHGAFDAAVDDGAGLDLVDFVLRAARDGAAMVVWHCAWAVWPDAAPTDIAAGHRFAERWIQI